MTYDETTLPAMTPEQMKQFKKLDLQAKEWETKDRKRRERKARMKKHRARFNGQ